MKKFLFILLFTQVTTSGLFSQSHPNGEGMAGKYKYTFVKNDPFNVHRFVLKNGFTILTSINKIEPRIQTYIAVKAGSKTDPKDNTGLAHYLEHMLFKGTESFGSIDYTKEKQYLDKIDQLYRLYNTTKDEKVRTKIYHQIDSVSGLAAKYAIANEYDKMMQNIGATGTNAFTSFEQTVYINDIPTNHLEKWLAIEGERFQSPVFRIFHTELEAVFEEKNISLDNDDSKAYEAIMAGLFNDHPYGTQTAIGTIEHLKNPSLDKIRTYYNNYYRPNNMALIMVGDFDEASAIAEVEKYFSKLESKKIPEFTVINDVPKAMGFETQSPTTLVDQSTQDLIQTAVTVNTNQKTILGPSAAFVSIGYRFSGVGNKETAILKLVSQLLYNGKGGLLDLDLVKSQKVSSLSLFADILKEHSYMIAKLKPKSGESLESLVPLFQQEIQKLKDGRFDEDLIKAVVANMKVDLIKRQESREGAAELMLDAYTTDFNWGSFLDEFDYIQTISKKDIVNFANLYFIPEPIIVFKQQGENKNIEKVIKPEITPIDVEANRDKQSAFSKKIDAMPDAKISPKFINYAKEISTSDIVSGENLLYVHNQNNDLYELKLVWDMGKEHLKTIPLAVQFLKYIGTKNYSADQINKELYTLATDFNVTSGNKRIMVSISGLKENMESGLKLVNELLDNAEASIEKFKEFKALVLKNRNDDLVNKNLILRSGLRNYSLYGAQNPFNYTLTNKEIAQLQPNNLIDVIRSLKQYKHKVYYYGPEKKEVFLDIFKRTYTVKNNLTDCPKGVIFNPTETKKPTVLFVNYDMVQAEVLWAKNEKLFDPSQIAIANLFQEYYGGGMGSIVFQTIRESKALAYSCSMRFSNPEQKNQPYIVTGYVGTQADKLFESIDAMNELLSKMPKSEELLKSCKSTILSQIETERINGIDIIFNYETLQKLGIEQDIRENIYKQMNTFEMKDVNAFFENYIQNGLYTICIVGSKKNINLEKLKKYGEIKELELSELFGY